MEREIKRALDVIVAGLGFVLVSPVLIGTALLIRLVMGAPVLFRQDRPGLDGRPFTILKFRTMRDPEPGEVVHRSDDERVTGLGRFLRKTSIDELPELWNVIRGDMSLVGPRPLLLEYLDKYTPEEARRHDVMPGITGWAQVNGRQSIPFSERLKLDLWYVDNWSLALDAKILLRTMLGAFRGAEALRGRDVDRLDDLGLSPDRTRERLTAGVGK